MTPGQLTFDDLDTGVPCTGKRDAVLAAREWKTNNPDAYLTMVRWAREDLAARRRPSIGRYAEGLRSWSLNRGSSPYRLDNSCRAPLARMIEAEFADLEGAFAKRASKNDPRIAGLIPGGDATHS